MGLAAEMVNLTAPDITIDFAAMGLNQESTALEVPALAGFNDPAAGAHIALPSCSAAAMARTAVATPCMAPESKPASAEEWKPSRSVA